MTVRRKQMVDFSKLNQVVADLESAVQAERQQYQDQIAAQQQEINDLKNPKPKILWGINATTKAQYDTQLALFGPDPLALRYYQNPGEPIGWPTEWQLRPDDVLVYSSKVLKPTVAQYVSMMSKAPKDRKTIVIPWHEYEDDIEKGHLTQADINALYHTARLAQQEVGPHIVIDCCLMGYTWQVARRDPEKFLPAEADYDMITTDTYFAGVIGQGVDKIPTAFDKQLATAAKHGKTWGITETGVGTKVTGQARLDAVKLLSSTIKSKLLGQKVQTGPLLGMWFNVPGDTGNAGAWRLDQAGVAAWKAGQQ
jgi:hypothetical protein